MRWKSTIIHKTNKEQDSLKSNVDSRHRCLAAQHSGPRGLAYGTEPQLWVSSSFPCSAAHIACSAGTAGRACSGRWRRSGNELVPSETDTFLGVLTPTVMMRLDQISKAHFAAKGKALFRFYPDYLQRSSIYTSSGDKCFIFDLLEIQTKFQLNIGSWLLLSYTSQLQ